MIEILSGIGLTFILIVIIAVSIFLATTNKD